ncbi:MAG: hypothetical protein QXP03_04330 [Desulfurococcaceae archaeon]
MELPPCVKMLTKNRKEAGYKDETYLNVLKSLPEDALEELLITLERGISEYLKSVLPPKTDFDIALGIAKKSSSVEVSAEVIIRGHLRYREDYGKLAQDAINYAKEVLIGLLEARRRRGK